MDDEKQKVKKINDDANRVINNITKENDDLKDKIKRNDDDLKKNNDVIKQLQRDIDDADKYINDL